MAIGFHEKELIELLAYNIALVLHGDVSWIPYLFFSIRGL